MRMEPGRDFSGLACDIRGGTAVSERSSMCGQVRRSLRKMEHGLSVGGTLTEAGAVRLPLSQGARRAGKPAIAQDGAPRERAAHQPFSVR